MAQLKLELKEKHNVINVRGNAEEVKKVAVAKGVKLTAEVQKVVEGWEGKPKGMRQVAFERGFINLRNQHLYTANGHKDDSGNIIDEDYSVKKILGECYC